MHQEGKRPDILARGVQGHHWNGATMSCVCQVLKEPKQRTITDTTYTKQAVEQTSHRPVFFQWDELHIDSGLL